MNKKSEKLLEILIDAKEVINANELSLLLDVSTKTIRNYVAEINAERKCIGSSNKGYSVKTSIAKQLLEETKSDVPQTQKERVSFILMKLLKRDVNSQIDLYDMSDELAVSYETIKKDFVLVKETLVEYNIFIQMNDSCVLVEGAEKDKRKLLSSLLSGEFNENVLSMDVLDQVFPNYDVKDLAESIQSICKDYHYFINEYALINLVLEISIGIDRIKNHFNHTARHHYRSRFGDRELMMVNKVVAKIEEKYQIAYDESELEEITNIMISSLMKMDYEKINMQNLEEVIGEDGMKLITILKEEMANWDYFNLDNEDFMIKFSLHIKNLRLRMNSGYLLKNPLTQHIKTSCPMIFEHAVEIANKIKHFVGCTINEHEIAFLALHIGSMMGETDYLKDRIKCILLFPQYYDYTTKLIQDINDEFEHDIVISNVFTNPDFIKEEHDLLISTIAVDSPIQTVQITPFLTRNDKQNIHNMIEKINLAKKKDYLQQHLMAITDPELFSKNLRFDTKQEVINYICAKMVQRGYVSHQYVQDVTEREHESSTAFGKLAVPHSFQMDAKKTSVYIMLLDKALPWDENNVNIILLFAIKSEERSLFFNIFDNLVTQLLEPSNLNSVLKSNTIYEFIENFVDCITTE